MRRITTGLVALAAVFSVAACGSDVPPPDKLDAFSWMDTMTFAPQAVASPMETGFIAEEPEPVAPQTPAAAPRAATPVRTASSAPRRASSGTYTPAPAPAPQTETVRHTARDAAIGAAGGAVIGAVAGGKRHRVKGAIIGAAAGAVIGGVIGHTVDTEERPIRHLTMY
jgi:uncharacterized protein YcfJ